MNEHIIIDSFCCDDCFDCPLFFDLKSCGYETKNNN